MTMTRLLPPAFADLERFVPYWACSTVNERIDARCKNTMPDIRAFYDAMIVRAADMLAHLENGAMHELAEDDATLLKLLLALAHAAIAVEIQQQPLPPKTTYPFRVKLVSGVAPFG